MTTIDRYEYDQDRLEEIAHALDGLDEVTKERIDLVDRAIQRANAMVDEARALAGELQAFRRQMLGEPEIDEDMLW